MERVLKDQMKTLSDIKKKENSVNESMSLANMDNDEAIQHIKDLKK